MTLTETHAFLGTFETATAGTRWEPGARDMALNAAIRSPQARSVYQALAGERLMPLRPGPRKPVQSTIRRRDHAQLVREAAARRRLEELREIREAMA